MNRSNRNLRTSRSAVSTARTLRLEQLEAREMFYRTTTPWNSPDLTYSYANLLDGTMERQGVSNIAMIAATREAMGAWAAVAPLHFTERIDSGPAVGEGNYNRTGHPVIRWGHHFIDGFSEDGSEGAHGAYPSNDGHGGDIHFDNGDNWDANLFLEVAAHEMGHALGMVHPVNGLEDEFLAIMHPLVGGAGSLTWGYDGLGSAFLLPDDVGGIQSLYGRGLGYVLTSAGDLHVYGTGGRDQFKVQVANGLVTVSNTASGSFTLSRQGVFSLYIHAQNGNDDIVVESNNGLPLYLDGGAGDDTIRFVTSTGDLGPLTAASRIEGGGGFDQIYLPDGNAGGTQTYTVWAVGQETRVSRPGVGEIKYSADIENVNLNTGRGNDTVNIFSTVQNTRLTLNSGGGRDVINVGMNGNAQEVGGSVTVNNSSNVSTINLNDSANQNTTVMFLNDTNRGTTELRRNGLGTIEWLAPQVSSINLTTGLGSDFLIVGDTSRGPTLNLRSAGGEDSAQIGAEDLSRMAMPINIQAGQFQLSLNDNGSTASRTAWISSTSFSGTAYAPITFANGTIASLLYNTGRGSTSTIMLGTPVGARNVTINGGDGSDTISVRGTTAGSTTSVGGGLGTNLILLGGDGNATHTLYDPNNLDNLRGEVTVGGGRGHDDVYLLDQATDNYVLRPDELGNGWSNQVVYTLSQTGIVRENTRRTSFREPMSAGGSVGVLTSRIRLEGQLENVEIFGGSTGNKFNLVEKAATLPLNLHAGAGNDMVTLGAATRSLAGLGGTLIDGEGGIDALTFSDGAAVGAQQYSWENFFGVSVIRRGAELFGYQAVENLTFNGNNAGNTYKITAPAVGTALTLNAGNGNDAIHVGSATQQLLQSSAALNINGQGGTNTLELHDEVATQALGRYVVENTQVRLQAASGAALLSVNYAGIAQLTLNMSQGSDFVHLYSTAAATRTRVNSGAGNDQFIFGDLTNRMNGIQGDLTLVGRAGDVDHFALYDWQETAGHTYRITADTITRDGLAPIHFYNMFQVGIYGGQGGDNYYLDRTTTGSPVYITDNAGRDWLYAPNTTNTWTSSGAAAGQLDAGSIYNAVVFSGIDGWVGGAGDDRYVLRKDIAISGWLDGRAGVDTLDYSAWTTNLYVNLRTNVATSIAQGVFNMQNVIAGSGNDLLVGTGGNVLTGGAGRDILIAGSQASTLNGGAGEDLLIAGTTNYDTNAAALQQLMALWGGSLDYTTRMARLQTGTGTPKLDRTTVFSNGVANTVIGDADRDAFFAVLGRDRLNDRQTTETVNG